MVAFIKLILLRIDFNGLKLDLSSWWYSIKLAWFMGKIVILKNLALVLNDWNYTWYVIAGWCCMCRGHGEMMDHLLLHFPRAAVLWNYVFSFFGVEWVLPGRVMNLLFAWRNCFGKHFSSVWNLVPSCLMWTVWRERNQCTFEDLESSESQFLETFVTSLFDWSRAWGFTSSISIASSIDSFCLTHTSDSL